MKQLICIVAATLVVASAIKAQSYNINPGPTMIDVAPYQSYTAFQIDFYNQISGNLNLSWEKISESIPAGWDYSLCDYGTCYQGAIPGSSNMDPIPQSTNGYFIFTINPFSIPGTATLKLFVHETGDTLSGDTIYYEITSQPVGIGEAGKKSALSMYPNPATENVTVTNHHDGPASFNIVNVIGEQLASTRVQALGTQRIDVTTLPKGVYFIQLQSSAGTTETQRLVVK